jgi:hypothetical protein
MSLIRPISNGKREMNRNTNEKYVIVNSSEIEERKTKKVLQSFDCVDNTTGVKSTN